VKPQSLLVLIIVHFLSDMWKVWYCGKALTSMKTWTWREAA